MSPKQLSALATSGSTMRVNYPEMRAGQAQWVALASAYPEVAERIQGSEADCFYDDDKIPAFFAAVEKEDA